MSDKEDPFKTKYKGYLHPEWWSSQLTEAMKPKGDRPERTAAHIVHSAVAKVEKFKIPKGLKFKGPDKVKK